MALSLNQVRGKPRLARPAQSGAPAAPRKAAVMPWQVESTPLPEADAASAANRQQIGNEAEANEPVVEPTTNQQQTDNEPATHTSAGAAAVASDETGNKQATGTPRERRTANRQQTSNEPATNQEQTSSKRATNRQQIENKPEAELAPIEPNRQQTSNGNGNKPATETATNRQRKRQQTDNAGPDLADLCGLQERALWLLFESCRFNASRQTEPLFYAKLAEALNTTPQSAKVSIQRLEGKGLIARAKSKAGRGGWTTYELPDPVYQALLVAETRDRNRQQTGNGNGNKPATKPATQPATEVPSRSSSTRAGASSTLPPTPTADREAAAAALASWELEDLDWSMLGDIGFGKSQAMQLRALGLPFDVVQRSLIYFEFELRHTPSGESMRQPLGLLMKRMRENGMWPPPDAYLKRQAEARRHFEERERGANLGETSDLQANESDLV